MTTDPAQFKNAEAWERGRALARRPLLVGALAAGLAAYSTSRPAPGLAKGEKAKIYGLKCLYTKSHSLTHSVFRKWLDG